MAESGALEELLQCLRIKHPDRSKAIETTKSVFNNSFKTGSPSLLKEDLARRISQKNFTLFERKWQRAQPKLVRPDAALEFLKEMACANEDEDSAFRSIMSMDKSSYSHSTTNRNVKNKENISQNTVSSILSSRSRPIYQSTPRDQQISGSTILNSKPDTVLSTPGARISSDCTNVSRADLVRDTLFAMEDIPGSYITYDENVDSFCKYRLKKEFKVDSRDRSHVESLGALGFYVREISAFIRQHEKQEIFGMIGSALLRSLTVELDEYRYALSNFRILPQLTLIYLKSATEKWRTRLENLYLLVFNVQNKRGGEILSVLHALVNHGHPMIRKMFTNVFEACAKPYMVQLNMWIYDGVLHDPYNEFLIGADLQQPVEYFWTCRYHLELKYLPTFITKTQAEKILLIGKSINFLREVCRQSEFSPLQEKALDPSLNIVDQIDTKIKNTYESTSIRLLSELNEVYNLPLHFVAMRNYMLLGQGDFVLHLLESLQQELDKPADELFRRNLAEHVETAISLTNAQFDHPDVLKAIDVRLHGMNPGDVGWDIFSLNYNVEGPLKTIFPTEVMKKYIRVFNFLLRAKRMEFNLNQNWSVMMSLKAHSREISELREVFFISNILQFEMVHFIGQLQYYIHFEIIESSWQVFSEKVEKAKDLDEVIIAHQAFLTELEEGCLLADTLWDKIKSLRSIFDQIVRFENIQKKLFDAIQLEFDSRESFSHQRNSRDFSEEDEMLEKERRNTFKNEMFAYKCSVTNYRTTYQKMVGDFLQSLKGDKVQVLSCLAWRLDYNSFYENSQVA